MPDRMRLYHQRTLQDMGISSFAFTLIDGDQLLFARDLVARGYRGGQSAAKYIRAYVRAQESSFGSLMSGTQALLVVVFASLTRLTMMYRDSGEHGTSNEVARFMHGFDSTDPMSFFENTDHIAISIEKSLGRVFDRLLDHNGCQSLVFLGPTWQRFASYLNSEPCSRHARAIRKTHAIPVPAFLRAIPSPAANNISLEICDFRECSSSAKTSLRRCSAQLESNPPPDAGSSAIEASKDRLGAQIDDTKPQVSMYPSNYVPRVPGQQRLPSRLSAMTATGRGSFGRSNMEENSRRRLKSRKEKHTNSELETVGIRARNSIPRNRDGKRIDLPINFDRDIRVALQHQGCCNNFHLRGYCDFGDGCKHKHGVLTQQERAALSILARGSPCRNGTGCSDEGCYSGHMCPYDPCRSVGGKCYYPAEMHFDDVQPVMAPATLE